MLPALLPLSGSCSCYCRRYRLLQSQAASSRRMLIGKHKCKHAHGSTLRAACACSCTCMRPWLPPWFDPATHRRQQSRRCPAWCPGTSRGTASAAARWRPPRPHWNASQITTGVVRDLQGQRPGAAQTCQSLQHLQPQLFAPCDDLAHQRLLGGLDLRDEAVWVAGGRRGKSDAQNRSHLHIVRSTAQLHCKCSNRRNKPLISTALGTIRKRMDHVPFTKASKGRPSPVLVSQVN